MRVRCTRSHLPSMAHIRSMRAAWRQAKPHRSLLKLLAKTGRAANISQMRYANLRR